MTSNLKLTYPMVQSPSWEANRFAASQEIPRISRNSKVHYCTDKRPPPVSIVDQPNLVHIPTFHLLEIYPNIIHPSTPTSHQWSPSLRFPQQDPTHSPLLTHTCHMPSPSHSNLIHHHLFEVNNKRIGKSSLHTFKKMTLYRQISTVIKQHSSFWLFFYVDLVNNLCNWCSMINSILCNTNSIHNSE